MCSKLHISVGVGGETWSRWPGGRERDGTTVLLPLHWLLGPKALSLPRVFLPCNAPGLCKLSVPSFTFPDPARPAPPLMPGASSWQGLWPPSPSLSQWSPPSSLLCGFFLPGASPLRSVTPFSPDGPNFPFPLPHLQGDL